MWLEREPTVAEVKAEFDSAPWHIVKEVVFCGFGEPTMRLAELVELLTYAKKIRPQIPTRLNTNGLGEVLHGREIAADFDYKKRAFSVKYAMRDCRSMSVPQLRTCVRILRETDRSCKSARTAPRLLLEQAIVRMLRVQRDGSEAVH